MPVTKENDRRGELLRRIFEVAAKRQGLWVEPALPKSVRSVLTWHPSIHPPRVAVAIVSEENAEKDYQRELAKYGASGTRELWVFDPDGYGRDAHGEGPLSAPGVAP